VGDRQQQHPGAATLGHVGSGEPDGHAESPGAVGGVRARVMNVEYLVESTFVVAPSAVEVLRARQRIETP
jgi:hypothetical protein